MNRRKITRGDAFFALVVITAVLILGQAMGAIR